MFLFTVLALVALLSSSGLCASVDGQQQQQQRPESTKQRPTPAMPDLDSFLSNVDMDRLKHAGEELMNSLGIDEAKLMEMQAQFADILSNPGKLEEEDFWGQFLRMEN